MTTSNFKPAKAKRENTLILLRFGKYFTPDSFLSEKSEPLM